MPPISIKAQLAQPGLFVKVGPFVMFVRSNVPLFGDVLACLYEDFPFWPSDSDLFADFHIGVELMPGLRRWLRPQVVFSFDGFRPFLPLAAAQAPVVFEGSMNWLIASHVNFYLALHAAVIERDGRAVIMPAQTGAGKSTLCAALVHRGWRLLSDEFALISFADGRIAPLARPISLKNRSIDVIRDLLPGSVLSAPIEDTIKGTVAFLKPPRESVRRMDEPAAAAWIVAPTYVAGTGAVLEAKTKAESFKDIVGNAYNFHLFGRKGFMLLADLVGGCDCYDFRYSDLDAAIRVFDRLAAAQP